MGFRNGFPICTHCGREIKRLTFEEQMNDIMGHGWSDWHTAHVHSCYQCYNDYGSPPCDECYSHRCERGIDCWWYPPLHLFPYETYLAEVNLEELLEVCFSTWFFTFKHDPERFAVVMSIASQHLRSKELEK